MVLDAKEHQEEIYDYDYVTCQESKPKTQYTCQRILTDVDIKITPADYRHFWCTSGCHPDPDDPHCRARKYYDPPKLWKPERVEVKQEYWSSSCDEFESMAKQRICRKVGVPTCPRGAETRMITIDNDGKPISRRISRNCWRWEQIYECSYPCQDSCARYRNQGCEQVSSKCKVKKGNYCVVSENTFKCRKRKKGIRTIKRGEERIDRPDITPNDKLENLAQAKNKLHQPPADSNASMREGIVRLSIIDRLNNSVVAGRREAQKTAMEKDKAQKEGKPYISRKSGKDMFEIDSRGNSHILNENPNLPPGTRIDPENIRIFVGNRCVCNMVVGGSLFKDCCNGDGGTLQNCDAEERELKRKRNEGKCLQFAGKVCVKRFLGVCIREQDQFCCFRSKMARVIHEQANQQLRRGRDDCRGFTITELNSINFENIDFKEVYAEILNEMNTDSKKAKALCEKTSAKLKNMTANFSSTINKRREL